METGSKARRGSVTILFPVFNDGPNVIPVLATLFETVDRPLRVIAIYDREDDPTKPVLEALARRYEGLEIVPNDEKRGCLPAIRTGLRRVESDYMGIWVSYHIDPMGAINRMLQKMDEGYDLVSANRFPSGSRGSQGFGPKRVLSLLGNGFVRLLLGLPIRDISTSIKLFRVSVLEKIPIETSGPFGWAVLVEWVLKLAREGRPMAEVELGPDNLQLLKRESNFRVLPQLQSYAHWMAFALRHSGEIRARYRKG